MKFLFFPSNLPAFHAYTLDERPMGGVVTGIIRLAQALADQGQEVFVLSEFEKPPHSNPIYMHKNLFRQIGLVDVLIAVRGWQPVFYAISSRKYCFWTGDTYQNLNTVGLGDLRVIDKLDLFFAKSRWQAETICHDSGFPLGKTRILTNGVYLPYFAGSEKRVRKRLIYSSTPVRGLKNLPRIYLELKKKHPDLELRIYSSFDRYSSSWPPVGVGEDRECYDIFKEVSALPDCILSKSLLQKDLAREYMKASILAYPTSFYETSCITAMEAMAGGCPIVTTKKAALIETVGNAGVLIDEDESYFQNFITAADRLLSDDVYWSQMSRQCLERSKIFDWNIIARELNKDLCHGVR